MRIEKLYEERTIKAFSENYDKNYIYFLFGGKENNQNKIKLFKFHLDGESLEEIKDIWVEKNDISNRSPIFKSIIQNKLESLIVNFVGGETIKLNIINLKDSEHNTIDLVKYLNKRIIKKISKKNDQKINSYKNNESKIVKIESNDNVVKFSHKLSNGYSIIAQDKKIFIVDNSFSYVYNHNFKDNYYTYCICQKSKTDVFICRSNGLYKLNLENIKDIDSVNDMKYYFILKIKDNDYIVSLNEGTFRVKRDIQSINKGDLKKENMISKKAYKIGILIPVNNKSFVILMENAKNEEGCLKILDIDNFKNNFIPINKNPYVLSKNCIYLLQIKEYPNNYIFLCATEKLKNYQKNGLLAFNINIESNKVIQFFYDTYNFRPNSITLYERGNNNNENSFAYFLVGGNIDSYYKFEIRLFKVMYLDGNGEDCLLLECIKKVFSQNDIQKYYSYVLQSIYIGHFLISTKKEFYLCGIRAEVKKEKKEEHLLYNSSDI